MMLPKFMSPFKFKVESQEGKMLNRRKKHVMSSIEGTTMDVGLRLLPQITSSKSKSSNVLVKSAVKKANQTSPSEFCFLKNCNLCNKQLSPDKDIYMYRGDQGFCSIECRDRQIVLDEMRELQISTKQMVASYGQCCNEARRETRLILEDLRMHRHKSKV
ncbi:FCS-Like Zinc finger 17-like [Lotus japonicus]|uniref:FCS-Like Zinc finger 17-like n=1 Tax=Lotus japonicus TaxID=34305 RepID=UPI002588D636|nr:FCS-Like Zinc finger 17-like [Lotus japonicus]